MDIKSFSMDVFSLKGRTAVVTGGNSGLGQAFSLALAKAGANILAASVVNDGEETRELVEHEEAGYDFVEVDITARGAPKKVIDRCLASFGRLDILVNNAGICRANTVQDFGRADWDPMISVNLTAAFEMAHEAATVMIPQRRGKIINVCSLYSFLGCRNSPAYAATKHGMAGLTKAYCDELAGHGIQVNGIAPGYFATDLTRRTREDPEKSRRIGEHIPADRWGERYDLMGAVVFLASDASTYVNGHLLAVDGGYLVR